MNKNITISLQDYVKRLWNDSNTKIPITIGKGTDTAKRRSKAPPRRGNESWYVSLEWYFIYLLFLASVHGFTYETSDFFTL